MEQKIQEMRDNMAAGDQKRDAGVIDPEGLIRHNDLRYGPHPENLLDVYLPEDAQGPQPTIISIHSGAWCYGSKQLYSHYCLRLAKRGFAVVNFDYRLAPESKYPAPLEDACQVLHWVAEHGGEYGIDKNNLFVVGDSAGGQLALQLLTMLTSEKYRKLFDFAPPLDLRVNACGFPAEPDLLPA